MFNAITWQHDELYLYILNNLKLKTLYKSAKIAKFGYFEWKIHIYNGLPVYKEQTLNITWKPVVI